jgi:ABC-type sugar transport system substrate-binding protein
MSGIDGAPADADRHEGFTEALKNYPDVKVVASVAVTRFRRVHPLASVGCLDEKPAIPR